MRKILFAEKLCLLILFLMFLSLKNAGAVSSLTLTASTPAAQAKLEYFLPYPGILPDHLLYPLKMLRDRVMDFLTTDSLKKTQLMILFADKRLGAGRVLIEGGKPELGEETISKAEKYLERAAASLEKAKTSGENIEDIWNKTERATRKHLELIEELMAEAPEQTRLDLAKIREGTQKIYQKVLGVK